METEAMTDDEAKVYAPLLAAADAWREAGKGLYAGQFEACQKARAAVIETARLLVADKETTATYRALSELPRHPRSIGGEFIIVRAKWFDELVAEWKNAAAEARAAYEKSGEGA